MLNTEYISWNERQEYAYEIGDIQAPPDLGDQGTIDLMWADQQITAQAAAPIGEPLVDFGVRCVYDSRPVNGFDFNISLTAPGAFTSTVGSAIVTYVTPYGYRMVVREVSIVFDPPPSGALSNITASLNNNGVGVPFNQNIVIGDGAVNPPIKTFFIVEENNTFGATVTNTNAIATVSDLIVNIYGNLIPVTDVPLPFCVTNKEK